MDNKLTLFITAFLIALCLCSEPSLREIRDEYEAAMRELVHVSDPFSLNRRQKGMISLLAKFVDIGGFQGLDMAQTTEDFRRDHGWIPVVILGLPYSPQMLDRVKQALGMVDSVEWKRFFSHWFTDFQVTRTPDVFSGCVPSETEIRMRCTFIFNAMDNTDLIKASQRMAQFFDGNQPNNKHYQPRFTVTLQFVHPRRIKSTLSKTMESSPVWITDKSLPLIHPINLHPLGMLAVNSNGLIWKDSWSDYTSQIQIFKEEKLLYSQESTKFNRVETMFDGSISKVIIHTGDGIEITVLSA